MLRQNYTRINRNLAILLAVLAIGAVEAPPPAWAEPAAVTADALKDRLDGTDALSAGGMPIDRAMLKAAYEARSYEPVWAAPELAEMLVSAIGAADREGLDPESFRLGGLEDALADDTLDPIDRELMLSDRFLAYAGALAQGRVAPASVDADWLLPRPAFDPAATLQRVGAGEAVATVLQSLLPHEPDYDRLRQALQHYQALADAGGWQPIVAPDKIEPGAKGDVVKAVRARLIIEGDFAENTDDGDIYNAPLVAAMKRFQARHGIFIDGRIGANTIAALNLSAADRVAAIRLALERLRSLPRDYPATRIMVNVPAASLVLYRDGTPALTSKVVVGSVEHPTPVFTARVVSVLFNPPWNVPTSIVKKEMQPELKRNPGYLAKNHYILVGRADGDPHGEDLDWKRTDILSHGWRLRQEPGPWNALGGVKLELPNREDIYLHDTPARGLFARAMRAASHGCIRVEAARSLVSILLGANWPAKAVDDAIDAGETRRVYLRPAVQVFIIYVATFVDDDGTVEFRDDIYGRDRRLSEALSNLQTQARTTTKSVPG